jgi:hypothetical protein
MTKGSATQKDRFTIYRERESVRIAERLAGVYSEPELVTAVLQVIGLNEPPRDSTVLAAAKILRGMLTDEAQGQWIETRECVRVVLSPAVFEKYIEPMTLIGKRGRMLYVRAPEHCLGRFEETLREEAPPAIADVIVLGPAEILR